MAIVPRFFKGGRYEVHREGLHLAIPAIERPIFYDMQPHSQLIHTTCFSREFEWVTIELQVSTRPCADQLPTFHVISGTDYKEQIFPAIAKIAISSVISKYNATELFTQQEKVNGEISKLLTESAAEYCVEVVSAGVTALRRVEDSHAAREAIKIAQFEAEMAKYKKEDAAKRDCRRCFKLIQHALVESNDSSYLEPSWRIEAAKRDCKRCFKFIQHALFEYQ